MKMIIGGAYQGQLAWAQAHFPEIADEDWIDGKECKETDIFTCKAIYGFHEYIRRTESCTCRQADPSESRDCFGQ